MNDKLDLTAIRHRLAPKEKRTAMEQARLEWRQASFIIWLYACGYALAGLAGLWLLGHLLIRWLK